MITRSLIEGSKFFVASLSSMGVAISPFVFSPFLFHLLSFFFPFPSFFLSLEDVERRFCDLVVVESRTSAWVPMRVRRGGGLR